MFMIINAMLSSNFSSGKILVHRNHEEHLVEINLVMHMLVLSILVLLICAQLNPRKITVRRMSFVVVLVKI